MRGLGDWGQGRKTDQSPFLLSSFQSCSDHSPPGLAPRPWARAPALPCLGPAAPHWLPPSFVPGRLPRPCGWAHGQSWSRRHNKPAQARPGARGGGRAAGAGRRARGKGGSVPARRAQGSSSLTVSTRACVSCPRHTHTGIHRHRPNTHKPPEQPWCDYTETKETGPVSTVYEFTVCVHVLQERITCLPLS